MSSVDLAVEMPCSRISVALDGGATVDGVQAGVVTKFLNSSSACSPTMGLSCTGVVRVWFAGRLTILLSTREMSASLPCIQLPSEGHGEGQREVTPQGKEPIVPATNDAAFTGIEEVKLSSCLELSPFTEVRELLGEIL